MGAVRDVRVRPALMYLASGWSTLVTDVHGRITGDDPQGFFAHNTRLLRREGITIDGREPVAFHTANVGTHAQVSYVELGDGEKLPSEAVYFTIERFLETNSMERDSDKMHYAEGLRLAGIRERDPPVANAPIILRPGLN